MASFVCSSRDGSARSIGLRLCTLFPRVRFLLSRRTATRWLRRRAKLGARKTSRKASTRCSCREAIYYIWWPDLPCIFLFPFGPGLPSPSSRANGPSLSPASDDTRLLQHQFRVLRWVHTIIWIIHTQQVTSRMGKHLESQNLCWPVVVGRKGDPDLAIKPGNRRVWSFHLFFADD